MDQKVDDSSSQDEFTNENNEENNNISIDGSTDLTISENQIAKFISCGWNAEKIDGHDIDQITSALTRAQNSKKPYLIACKTIIGYGCPNKQGSEIVHGAAVGSDETKAFKKFLRR